MDFYEVLKARRSIRAYDAARPIPDAALEKIMGAVQCAPSACNRQPWRFEIIFNAARRAAVAECYPKKWLAEAPAIVVALGNESTCWKRLEGSPAVEIDIGIAMEHFVLAAAAEGLGTCWICAFEKARLNAALGVQPPWGVQAISPLGYSAEAPRSVQYKDLAEIFQVIR